MNTISKKISAVAFPVYKSQAELYAYWFRQANNTVICATFTKEKKRNNFFELNFHVLQQGKLKLFARTNNNMAIRTFNTMALIVFDFMEKNKSATVVIEAPDRPRNIFYHSCITRMKKELEQNFFIWGIYYFGFEELYREEFRHDRFYDEIAIALNSPGIPHARESKAYKMSEPEQYESIQWFL